MRKERPSIPEKKKYDVAIIGGGVTGTALFYMLCAYTDIERIILLEKHNDFAQVNSHFSQNSQTLHFGDIETNFSLEKALRVKEAADMTASYVERCRDRKLFFKGHKMALAVGDGEVRELEDRFEMIKEYYPKIQKLNREGIASFEPKVVEGRDYRQKISGLYSPDGYIINYYELSKSFIESGAKENAMAEFYLGTEVREIKRRGNIWGVDADRVYVEAEFVVFASGPHSLVFAKSLGYGRGYGILSVAGNFYAADDLLRGKVYTMQIEKLPFAAVHGDPNIVNLRETRFGPTTKVLPLLERKNYRTMFDFIKTSAWNFRGVVSLLTIIIDPVIFKFVVKNLLFSIPLFGRWLFLQDIKKIVPVARFRNLRLVRGGIRPQVVNTTTMKMEMGEVKIVEDGIIFDITPSPGASVCLKNAENNARVIVGALSGRFDEEKFRSDFLELENNNLPPLSI